tara:strand:- start:2018 stop:2740 length:723 start_codon:yes stop_codon:yes gene_type:complete
MAKTIAVVADTGFGKSTALVPIKEIGHKGLNPKETLIINVKNKPLPFKGWKKHYLPIKSKDDLKKGNYLASSDYSVIIDTINYFNEHRKEIINVVIDDFQYIMADNFMKDALKSGYDKFNKLAKRTYDVINAGMEMRDQVNFIILTHSEIVETQDFGTSYKMKTIGKMLDDKVNLEGLFTVLLYGKSSWDGKEGVATRNFVTNMDGQYPAKSPYGMFDNLYISNDLGKVLETMNAYYEGE